jgi:hypothetical protein
MYETKTTSDGGQFFWLERRRPTSNSVRCATAEGASPIRHQMVGVQIGDLPCPAYAGLFVFPSGELTVRYRHSTVIQSFG